MRQGFIEGNWFVWQSEKRLILKYRIVGVVRVIHYQFFSGTYGSKMEQYWLWNYFGLGKLKKSKGSSLKK